MLLASAPENHPSLIMIEGSLTAIAIAVSFAWPRLGSRYFSRLERICLRIARRQGLSVAVVGAAALLLRLAVLPLFPIPQPFIPDDFSFLLSADTFASGRLANPSPPMWVHFETIHVTMKPTYASMYFPAQGLVLAAGRLLTGHPWFGMLAMTALMCAAICWMLQAWLPPGWALLGGLLAVLRLGLFSYWINTYSGGAIAAFAGALVLGAMPRFMRGARMRHGMLLALGVILLAISRPYEGLLLCLPVAIVLSRWAFSGKNTPPPRVLMRRAALPVLLIFAAGAWMGYYDYRAFGSPLTPPYKIDRATYAVAPYYVWQSPRPQPVYHSAALRNFYLKNELPFYNKIHSVSGFLPQTLIKALNSLLFFAGIVLLPPLVMLRRVLKDRRVRFLVLCLLILMAGMLIEIFLIPHYLAPFTAAFYALGLQAMRHLRQWKPGDQPVGMALTRLTITICILMAGLRVYAGPLQIAPPEWPASKWVGFWYGPGPFGTSRAQIETRLEHLPGKQLVLVRYSADHEPLNEWVYNTADIDQSKVIWAREMDPSENLELLHYYEDRTVWLVQPDTQPAQLSPYPIPGQKSADLK